MDGIRIGIVGAGANVRARHLPTLLQIEGVEVVGVCNRHPESTQAVAHEFSIPKMYDRWTDLVSDPEINAVVIGTWPYLHAPITIAALESGKHVLCEARMARNLAEARAMYAASRRRPELVAQLVPSPYGMRGDRCIKRLLASGAIGAIRELHVYGMTQRLADPNQPLTWRQSAEYSGLNTLTLGIVHETAMRWAAPVTRVLAQTHRFNMMRFDTERNRRVLCGSPDSVHVLTEHADGSRGVYQFSGVTHFGLGHGICLYGSDGTIHYRLDEDTILGARANDDVLRDVPVTEEETYRWRVDEEFVNAIRGVEKVEFNDFATGVAYMAFVDAVAKSALLGQSIAVEPV